MIGKPFIGVLLVTLSFVLFNNSVGKAQAIGEIGDSDALAMAEARLLEASKQYDQDRKLAKAGVVSQSQLRKSKRELLESKLDLVALKEPQRSNEVERAKIELANEFYENEYQIQLRLFSRNATSAVQLERAKLARDVADLRWEIMESGKKDPLLTVRILQLKLKQIGSDKARIQSLIESGAVTKSLLSKLLRYENETLQLLTLAKKQVGVRVRQVTPVIESTDAMSPNK